MRVYSEDHIQKLGRELFAAIRGKEPTLFNSSWWTGKAMETAMANETFKIQLFRFIDCLPSLRSSAALADHVEEYFGDNVTGLPAAVQLGAESAGGLFGRTLRKNIETMARLFIGGATPDAVLKTLRALRKAGYAFTVDRLGEATVSEAEAAAFREGYLDLLQVLGRESPEWPLLPGVVEKGGGDRLDWGFAPPVNLSVKPTAFHSQVRPVDLEGSVAGICEGLRPVLCEARNMGAYINLDMEQYRVKEITLEVFRRLRSDPDFRDYPHFGLVLQAYLVDTEGDLEDLLAWSRSEGLPLSVRLVKGAYWDYETVTARQHGWQVPVHTAKAATDASFERLARRILENHEQCYLSCASHNIRSVAAVLAAARSIGVPREKYEFQVLYGMAEPVRRALMEQVGTVRLYVPFGELLPGLSYLVRRLLENTSNESFVRRRFAEAEEEELLLKNPVDLLQDAEQSTGPGAGKATGEAGEFCNHPLADFTDRQLRERFGNAFAVVRSETGRLRPLVIDGREKETADTMDSVNPADPAEAVGRVSQAGPEEVETAVAAAREAHSDWRERPAGERAAILFRAAAVAREKIVTLSAWQVLETGKQWDQAYGDVAEAIDYFEYYGREILRLDLPRRLGRAPGETNSYFYQPRGVAAVIAPWNFPLAISTGMTAAALAAGCTVVYKPSNLSPVMGAMLADLYGKAGIPDGVFNFLPGPGGAIGSLLVEHPAVDLIAFTGSMEVGLDIIARAAKVRSGQQSVKKVIAEMGGKNAVIIDDDADLDEAVPEVLASAFAYQGQKCSACSRVIVLADVHDAFTRRLVEAARSISIGPAENPTHYLGPLIDAEAQKKVRRYIDLGHREGSALLIRDEAPGPGHYAPLAIFDGLTPDTRLGQEEIFGPVLAVMKARDFTEALAWANATPYALTGSVFSRSPRHLEQARHAFRVGNLYLNRGCTGALVERQPFGGFGMSGIGSKAGGPDYLLQFLEPRTVTENTVRRGFAPNPD